MNIQCRHAALFLFDRDFPLPQKDGVSVVFMGAGARKTGETASCFDKSCAADRLYWGKMPPGRRRTGH